MKIPTLMCTTAFFILLTSFPAPIESKKMTPAERSAYVLWCNIHLDYCLDRVSKNKNKEDHCCKIHFNKPPPPPTGPSCVCEYMKVPAKRTIYANLMKACGREGLTPYNYRCNERK